MPTVSETMLRRRYNKALDRLGVSSERFPYRSRPLGDGSPHVEIVDDHYHYVVSERGTEFERRSTQDASELLYWLVHDVAFELACDFELRHREPGQDFRRLLFKKQLELLRELSADWEQRAATEIDQILQTHPFTD